MRFAAHLFATVALASSPGLGLAETLSGRVVAIADGDTVTVLDRDNVQKKIRLSGIDAPEKRQAFGSKAKEKISELTFGKQVDVDWTKTDRNGRIVGKVRVAPSYCPLSICPKSVDAGLEMVSAGFAWHYKKYQKEQSVDDRQKYASAEDLARKKKAGLWSDPDPIAPWDFRRKD